MKKNKQFLKAIHYYLEGERVVFTALFHLERGQCCGSGCRHCPYVPKHNKGSILVEKKVVKKKKNT